MPGTPDHSPLSYLSPLAMGALLGTAGGIATAPENKMLRSAARGGLIGAGTGAGVVPGAMLGGLAGLPLGAPGVMAGAALGGMGGGAVGNWVTRGLLGPAETDEEKFERLLRTARTDRDGSGPATKEKTAMHPIEFGMKLAASSCTPCAMPNGPANKKHMTGASPAVLEAGQKSEEIGTPETLKTEHAEAKAKLPEEGAKSAAYVFGMQAAALFGK